MMIETIAQATAVLQNQNETEGKRAAAARYLGEKDATEAIDLLVATLDDSDYGVHWAASEALAQLGDAALPPLLKVLAGPNCSPRVIHGAKHIFHTSSSAAVRAQTQSLLQNMHGSAQDVAVMEAASDLMGKLHIA